LRSTVSPKVLLIASGGGHTGFARAIAQHMPFKPDFVVPRGDKLSAQIALTNASRIYEVTKWRSPDGGSSGLGALRSLWESLRISRYDIVLATGSNHSIFPSLVQRLKGAKLYVVESQDRIVTKGKAVYLLSFLSKGVFLHWESQRRLYPRKGIVVGPIVEKPRYFPSDMGYVLVTTGSMGFPRLVKRALKLRRKVVIQTGPLDPSDLSVGENVTAFQFDPDLERWIAGASIVVTHQGKTAMEAVVMYRKPVVIVYNRDWRRAASLEDTKLYARELGATFLDDPLTWRDESILERTVGEVKPPKPHESGTPKLVDIILGEVEECG
jgi:UDP-N-acetylglucosamine--N-acetylmuramyl-(pentapeptide) pyrophosphoryl-undecaprenol N-acetylglucosamine transferase